jgi:hypothetical protein
MNKMIELYTKLVENPVQKFSNGSWYNEAEGTTDVVGWVAKQGWFGLKWFDKGISNVAENRMGIIAVERHIHRLLVPIVVDTSLSLEQSMNRILEVSIQLEYADFMFDCMSRATVNDVVIHVSELLPSVDLEYIAQVVQRQYDEDRIHRK